MNTTISTKQLRENFDWVLDAMNNGETLTLLYRSKPLAEIKPLIQTKPQGRNFSDAQINQWLSSDRLTKKQQLNLDAIINHLP
jgi:antitoxin (DNA-binding transcriptional repressor) of toxin-antitoxin stability system